MAASKAYTCWFGFFTVSSELKNLNHVFLDNNNIMTVYAYDCFNHELFNVDPSDPLALTAKGAFLTFNTPVTEFHIRNLVSKYPHLSLERLCRPSYKIMDDFAQRRVVKSQRGNGVLVVDEYLVPGPVINQRF